MKQLRITIEGKTYDVQVEIIGEEAAPFVQPLIGGVSVRAASPVPAPAPAPKKTAPPAAGGAGDVPSPLAAVVVSVDVHIGQSVNEGDKLVTLEAMKMNTVVTATGSGKVTGISVKQGDAVEEGQTLVTVE
jgi:biotin carboxyl carrier protein